jgi:DNA invertase Pin-like site-specific DNA recombinase
LGTSARLAEWEREIIRERIADQRGAIKARGERSAGGRRPDGEPGMHAPIVAPELFERVQRLVQGRRTRTPTKRSERGTDEQTAPVQAARAF